MSNSNDLLLYLFDSVVCDDQNTFTYTDIKITCSSANTENEIKALQSGDTPQPTHYFGDDQFIAYDVDISTKTYFAEDKESIIRSMHIPRPALDFPSDEDTMF